MPARQSSTPRLDKKISNSSRAPLLPASRPKPRTGTSLSGAVFEATRDSPRDEDAAGPSQPRASTSKAPLHDRKHPLSKQQSTNARSRIPIVPRAPNAIVSDVKGKGREIIVEEPRKSPTRKATHQNYALNESASSEDDEEMYMRPKQSTSSQVTFDEVPVQTPRNARGNTPKRRVASSSAVRQGSARARTASLAPGEVWSAMKPIPLKTIYLSSPPRPGRSSDTESSSESDDEVRLIEPPTTSARKRKAAAGEYTWDERSRSCIPKRERSRSRSLTASGHRNRYSTPGDHGDDDRASDRSHLQDRVFPTSDNDLLRSLLTNRFQAKARAGQSTPAKREQLEDPRDPFLETPTDHLQDIYNETDIYMDLPDIQEDNLAAEQPIFNFSYSGLPDDDSDDDDGNAGPRADFLSSDDGFERSVIHLNDSLNEVPDLPEIIIDSENGNYQIKDIKSEIPEKDIVIQGSTHSSDATEILPEDIDESTALNQEPVERRDLIDRKALAPVNQAHLISVEVSAGQKDQIQSMRSSSVVSDLPPSSPPPLPSYQSESAISDEDNDVAEAVADIGIPSIKIATPSNLSAGPLSPKTTNRLARSLSTARSPSPRVTPNSLHSPRTYYTKDNARRSATPDTLILVQEHLTKSLAGVAQARQTQDDDISPKTHKDSEAALLTTSPPAASKQPSPGPLPQLSNDQLFSRLKSPRIPQMTPVRLRTASPAAFAVYSMVETGATPTLTRGCSTGGSFVPLRHPADDHEQDDAHASKVEALSPLQPSTATFGTPKSPRISPRPATTLSFPPLSASARCPSRSLTPLSFTIAASQRSPSITQDDVARPDVIKSASPAGRSRSPIPQPGTLLAPPSPFLQRSSRSPSPNRQAEQAAASLLDRVRALRSPSIAKTLEATILHDAEGQPESDVEPAVEQPIEEQPVQSTTNEDGPIVEPEHNIDATHDGMDEASETNMSCDRAELPALPNTSTAATTVQELQCDHDVRTSAPESRLDDGDDISSTGLTDARCASDSEAEDLDVEIPFLHKRTPSKSPAVHRVLLPLRESPLSPNVTVRRDRSASRSTASARSTKSIKSNKVHAKSPTRRARRMSFADIGSLHSSPLSVAASIGRASFDALDSSSEDEEENEAGSEQHIARPSPSKAIAAQQLRYGHMQEDQSGSSDDEGLDLSSSPTRSIATDLVHTSPRSTDAPLNTSTPARMMHTLELQSSDISEQLLPVTVSTPNPRRRMAASPKPAASPHQRDKEITTSDGNASAAAGTKVSLLTTSFEATEDQEHADLEPKVEGCQDSQLLEDRPDDSYAETILSVDTSAALDEARPRTSLIVPPLANVARPSPARFHRSSHTHPAPSILMTTPHISMSETSEATRAVPLEAPCNARRSQSVVSRQESVTSQASTVVQVSSADPLAAARAAAILKVHHHYIQEGPWLAGVDPLSRAASGSSEEGERALDDLLKQAEREVSATVQESSQSLRIPADSSQEESSMDVMMASHDDSQRERSISASRHFIDQSKLDVWTRHDWRALEQCFIDELRRKRSSREQVEPAEVVRLYLESEQLRPEQCIGQRRPELLGIRVEALIARKQQKGPRVNRERSHSVVSTAYSRAPSDFFVDEDAHMRIQQTSESFADTTYLDIPGALLSPGRRRYARSAEPVRVERPSGQQDYARHRGITKFQSLQRRLPIHTSLSRETSLSSVAEAEEAQSISSEPPFSSVNRSLSRLYPSLEDLRAEMKPKKLLPVRGRSVAAAVDLFEKIEEEQSVEAQLEQTWLKRKASEQDLLNLRDSNKKVRI